MFGPKKNPPQKKINFGYILIFLLVLNLLQGATKRDKSIEEKFISSFNQGENQLRDGHYDIALESFKTSLRFAKIKGDERGEFECYKNMGLVFWNMGQLDKSKEFYSKAQMLAEKYEFYETHKDSSEYLRIFRLYDEGKYNPRIKMPTTIESFLLGVE